MLMTSEKNKKRSKSKSVEIIATSSDSVIPHQNLLKDVE